MLMLTSRRAARFPRRQAESAAERSYNLIVMRLKDFAASGALVASLAAPALASQGGTQVQAPPPTQNPPSPRPFPGAGAPAAGTAKPADTATAPQATPARPTDTALGGAPVYPGAEFIDSYDAGSGQRYFLYGTDAPFLEIVAYYKKILNSGGRELFKAPAMHQFDLGRYQEETMAYPPSVVVKDHTWNGSAGYAVVVGTQQKRFKTIIQIVPVR